MWPTLVLDYYDLSNFTLVCSRRMEVLSCSMSSISLPPASLKYKGSTASCKHSSIVTAIPSLGFPRKQVGVYTRGFKPDAELCRPIFATSLQKRCPIPRNVVVKSEIAEAGSSDASYSLSELQLDAKVRGICFYAVTAFLAISLFLLMLVVHPFVILFDRYRRRAHHFIAKVWATFTVLPFSKVEFEGLENLPAPDSPAVYVSNHQSFLDIYTLMILGIDFKFISKTSIFVFPIIGWAMYFLGTIPLKRMDTRSQLDCLKRCMDLVKKGTSIFFFPEGTRSKDGKLGAFKKGAFSVAAKTGVPVVPITLMGTGKLMPVGMETSLSTGPIKVVIHKPIEGKDPDILCEKARNVISESLVLHG